MIKKTFFKSFLLLLCMIVGGTSFSPVCAAENDTHDFSQSLSQLLNNNASIASIEIAAQTYPVKEIIVSYRYNNTKTDAVTMEVSVAGSSWGTFDVNGTGSNYSTKSFTHDAVKGAITISFTNNTGSGTKHGTFYVDNVQLVEGSSGPATYSVTYDGNGNTSGTAPTDESSPYESGATVTVLGTGSLAKTGYTFGGWNTKADGSGINYTAGSGTFNISANTTLYAKWNVNQYNVALASVDDVTLSASYGTSSSLAEDNNADIDYGAKLTLSAAGLASGYMFSWTVTDGEDKDVTSAVLDGSTLTVPAYNITISGTVTEIPLYTVTFNAGTGSCATASLKEASQNAGVTLPTATIGVTGWSFAGWATASTTNTEDAPTLYTASSTYKPSSNITLYAVYKFIEGTENQYKRATSVSEITTAGKVVIVSNKQSKMLDNTLAGNISAPSETESKITAAAKDVFTVTGNSTDGYTLKNGSLTVGVTATTDNTVLSNTTTNSLWTINTHNTTNAFYFENKAKSKLCLEHDGTNWCVYAPSTPSSNSYNCLLIYIPNFAVAYNSNPAAIVNPTIAWTTSGNKSLYVQGEDSYTNAANVTGISKSVTYTSSNETVATVNSAGVVNALKAGSTTITATVAAEVGVNTKATASYTITVKDAKTIAGLKAITSSSSVVTFTADLTDAVVTYVNGNHAFIQDASGAVYASCGSSLTAGKKINGAISGSIKAANQIDEITAIDLSDATVTDGVIPTAAVISAATLAANTANYEGKLVSIENATVTASLTSGNASGGKISDDGKVTEINLYAPDSNIDALKDAKGTFNGYITLHNGSSVRFNIFEQSQITLTKNAPTDQPLEFASDAIELDEETSEFTAFSGQTVSGAQGTVTYSIDSDDDGVVTSINSETGAVELSGNYGTATIKASAAAKVVTVAGVTTPYNATTKTYTITVYPRYTSTFNINGDETVLRQATHGASIVVPTPAASIGDYSFIGWSTSTVATTNDAPATVTPPTTPESSVTYYAVYALERESGEEKVTSTLNLQQSEPADSKSTVNGVAWSWSKLTFATSGNNVGMKGGDNATVTIKLPNNAIKAVKLSLVRTQNWGDATVVISNSSGELGSIGKTGNAYYEFTSSNNTSGTYSLSQSTSKNAWISSFTMEFTVPGIENYGYCTTLPVVSVTIPASTYAARCFNRPLDYSSASITVYTAKLNTTTHAVTLTEVASGKVPANEGVIIHADAGTYAVPVAASADALSNNEMVGVTARTQVQYTTGDTYYNYILQTENGDPVFNMATGAYLPAGRAYLHTQYDASSGAGARLAVVFEDGQTTTIQGVSVRNIAPDTYYNLKGQRVENPKKGGIYVKNGKKVIFK